MIRKDTLLKLCSISLKARILREAQRAAEGNQEFTEREILTLELVQEFSPITEKTLCNLFRLSPSSVSDIVGKLTTGGYLAKQTDESGHTRGRPLELTETGVDALDGIKSRSAARFAYFFADITEEKDWAVLASYLDRIDRSTGRIIKDRVFGRTDLNDLFGSPKPEKKR